MKMIIALFLLFPLAGYADDFRIAANTLILADWAQTRYISTHPDDYYETNSSLGEHPSIGKVNRHFLITLAKVDGLGWLMPHQYQKYWFAGWAIYEASFVLHNHSIGIGMKL